MSALFVTFKVTREGEVGSPMDHVLTSVPVGPDGEPDEAALALVVDRVRRELRRVAGQPAT